MPANVRRFRSLALAAPLLVAAAPLLFAAALPQKPPAAPPPKIPAEVFVDEAPEDAKCVAEVKKSAKKGDEVVIAAKIGGRAEPFIRNRAMFLVADRCLRSCDEIPGDTCVKPWDYCCEPAESLKANTATILIAGPDGKPLKCPAQGVAGLEPLALVVIEGKVVERDDKGVFVVEARRIHVEPKKPKAAPAAAPDAESPEKPQKPGTVPS